MCWEACLQAEHPAAEVVDQGELFPLLLNITPRLDASQACSLQTLLITWRNQAHRYAAVSLSALLTLQVGRFGPDGSKLRFRVTTSARVYFPYYTGLDARTSSHPYRLLATVYHLSPTRDSGHLKQMHTFSISATTVTNFCSSIGALLTVHMVSAR